MKSLRDQLVKTGLADEQTAQEVERQEERKTFAEQKQTQQKLVNNVGKSAHLEALQSVESVSKFRNVARNLLLKQPEMIQEVIQEAHRFRELPGGKKLIWQVYQVKGRLPDVPENERERFLKRAFRKSGATFEEPIQ